MVIDPKRIGWIVMNENGIVINIYGQGLVFKKREDALGHVWGSGSLMEVRYGKTTRKEKVKKK